MKRVSTDPVQHVSDGMWSATTLQTLKRVAKRLGIDQRALQEALHAMPMARTTALGRVDRVTTGLARELGGQAGLREWAHSPIAAFGNRKPVDILTEGRIEPLERIEAVLRSGVYS